MLSHSTAERVMSIKNSMTPQGIDPTTFLLLAQRFHQMRRHKRVVSHFSV